GIRSYFGQMLISFVQAVKHLLILFVSIFLIRVSRLHPIHLKTMDGFYAPFYKNAVQYKTIYSVFKLFIGLVNAAFTD
ncbi:MAG TPA: hypothetical protein VK609_17560, partial [Mucilaginibacter sp.]|nr:hypothetical protein [Mucilaginibacter sp.]